MENPLNIPTKKTYKKKNKSGEYQHHRSISGGCRKPVEAPRQALRLGPMALGIFGRGLKFRFGDPRCYEFSWAIAKHFRHENIKKTGLMLLFQLFLVAFPFRAVSKDMKKNYQIHPHPILMPQCQNDPKSTWIA